MKDIVGLVLLATLILVVGLGFSELLGTVLQQRAVLQAEHPR